MKKQMTTHSTQTSGSRLRQRSTMCIACANGSSHIWVQVSTGHAKPFSKVGHTFFWTRTKPRGPAFAVTGATVPPFALVQITFYGMARLSLN